MPATRIRWQIQGTTRTMRAGLCSLLRGAHGGMDSSGAKARHSRTRRTRKRCEHAIHPQSRDHAGARWTKHERALANTGLWSLERLPKAVALLYDPARRRRHHPPNEARCSLGARLGPYPICSPIYHDVLPRQRKSEGVGNPVARSIPDLSICRR